MIAPPWHVLVLPGGTESGLEINRALRDSKEVILFSAGVSCSSAAEVRFANHSVMPSVFARGWLSALNVIIEQHNIDFVYPAHDDVVVALAEQRDAVNAVVVTSPLETCQVARLKSRTYAALEGVVPIPRTYKHVNEVCLPVFVKPDRGQGSQHARAIHDLAVLHQALEHEKDLLMLEYLPGDEYTVDCFSDRELGLLHAQPRQRLRMRAGIAMHTIAQENAEFKKMAAAISERLKFHGAWFFQARRDKHGTAKLLEVAPRISGSMALSRVRGVNFPLLSIYEQMRIATRIAPMSFSVELNRSLDNHYLVDLSFSAVYIDLDDTLVSSEGKVNTRIVRFLFQCINRSIPVILLTRNKGDLAGALSRYRLNGLFDKSIRVSDSEEKADFILEKDAIFIDDSFTERYRVAQRGITTFEPAAVECLIDERA